MVSSQVPQVRSLLVIRQVGADPIDHHHDECAIIHVQPVGAADKLVGAIANERTVGIRAEVWLVELRHEWVLKFGCRSGYGSSSALSEYHVRAPPPPHT